MKRLGYFLLVFTLTMGQVIAQKLEFSSLKRESGTAFFSINKSSGQLMFMLDHGSNAGKWKKYGELISRTATDPNLSFYVEGRTSGSAFFALDGSSGQLYFMLDYGANAGKWKSYGSTVPKSGNGILKLSGEKRTDGSAFFAIDSQSGQIYFMLDYGSNAAKWKAYGELPAE